MKLARVLLIVLAALIAACPAALCYRRDKPAREAYALTEREATPIEITALSGDVDVNLASADELTKLYGVGDTLAREIVREREENGSYYYIEDLLAVRGIGRSKLNGFLHQLKRPALEGE